MSKKIEKIDIEKKILLSMTEKLVRIVLNDILNSENEYSLKKMRVALMSYLSDIKYVLGFCPSKVKVGEFEEDIFSFLIDNKLIKECELYIENRFFEEDDLCKLIESDLPFDQIRRLIKLSTENGFEL